MSEKPSNSLYSVISGTANQSVIPSSSALESLKLLQFFNSASNLDPDIKALVDEETKYLKSAIRMVNTDPLIASKFGTDLTSAMNLSGLLKEIYSEKSAKDHLLNYINAGAVETSEAQKKMGELRRTASAIRTSD